MQEKLEMKFKRLTKIAKAPFRGTEHSAGLDLYADRKWIDRYGNICYGTGIAVEIPKGYMGLLFPRSSVSKKTISLANSVGVIDSDYRGEVLVKFKPTLVSHNGEHTKGMNTRKMYADAYDVGDRVVQLIVVPYPKVELKEISELTKTDRNEKGFVSTGN